MDSGSWSALNRISYINPSLSNVQMLNYNQLAGNFFYDSSAFGYPNPVDAVQLDDFGVYKDIAETALYIRDRVLNKALASAVLSFDSILKMNFRVQRRSSTSKLYDILVCTKNNAPSADICRIYEVNTTRATSSTLIQVTKRSEIVLPNS